VPMPIRFAPGATPYSSRFPPFPCRRDARDVRAVPDRRLRVRQVLHEHGRPLANGLGGVFAEGEQVVHVHQAFDVLNGMCGT